ADLPRLHAAGHHRRLQRRALQRAGAGLVGAQHGRQPHAHAVGRGGAERDAGDAQRRAHRARAVLHPAGELRADRGARGARLSDRLPRRQRELRSDVRGGAHGRVPGLCRRPHLSPGHASGAAMADVALTAGQLAQSPASRALRTLAWGFARIFSVVALAVAWEWFARSGAVTPFMLPRLTLVLERIWSD